VVFGASGLFVISKLLPDILGHSWPAGLELDSDLQTPRMSLRSMSGAQLHERASENQAPDLLSLFLQARRLELPASNSNSSVLQLLFGRPDPVRLFRIIRVFWLPGIANPTFRPRGHCERPTR
jgi:hypothetical protein